MRHGISRAIGSCHLRQALPNSRENHAQRLHSRKPAATNREIGQNLCPQVGNPLAAQSVSPPCDVDRTRSRGTVRSGKELHVRASAERNGSHRIDDRPIGGSDQGLPRQARSTSLTPSKTPVQSSGFCRAPPRISPVPPKSQRLSHRVAAHCGSCARISPAGG